MKVCFIGFGNMAKAIAKGLETVSDLDIHACSPSQIPGTEVEGVSRHCDNNKGSKDSDVIILAVKPAKMHSVIQELHLTKPALIISVAAAIPLQSLEKWLPVNTAIVRAMPNTPIAVGQGATPMVANGACLSPDIAAAEQIFAASGMCAWMEESQLEALAPVSGSGPAYVFLFIEALLEASKALGLEEDKSLPFILQTFSGALSLLESSHKSPSDLRRQVTSPAGTTEQALNVFQKNNFHSIVTKALKAAHNRAIQLREELE
jgi:pyrroline-5-carboxylate reductase